MNGKGDCYVNGMHLCLHNPELGPRLQGVGDEGFLDGPVVVCFTAYAGEQTYYPIELITAPYPKADRVETASLIVAEGYGRGDKHRM